VQKIALIRERFPRNESQKQGGNAHMRKKQLWHKVFLQINNERHLDSSIGERKEYQTNE